MKKQRKNLELTALQKSVIIGTVLGDGCLRVQYKDSYGTIEHSIKQLEYLKYKKSLIENLCSDKINYRERKPKEKDIVQSISKSCSFRISTNKNLNEIYYLLYINGKKRISENLLKYIDEVVICLWYLDDGWLSYDKTRKANYKLGLSTHSFSKEENELLVNFFLNKYNIKFLIGKQGNNYFLNLNKKEEIIKFINLIKNHTPKCMYYKIDLNKHFKK